jgi:DNA invertase Pin-like site-specific DNA recombinase
LEFLSTTTASAPETLAERVSTKRQGTSGLVLEAQRKAIDDLAASRGAEAIARFTEIESGKLANRPELAKALHLAKVTGSTLLIAKLDRLSRNASFLLTLRDSGVRFVAADMPEAKDLTVGIMVLVAEQEREAISRRTREALAAARARGVRLGNPQRRRGVEAGWEGRRAAKGAHRTERRPARGEPNGLMRGSKLPLLGDFNRRLDRGSDVVREEVGDNDPVISSRCRITRNWLCSCHA